MEHFGLLEAKKDSFISCLLYTSALCDVLLFWDELFYYESFGLFAALILVQLVATGAAAFRFYYKQRKGLTEKRLNRK